MHPKDIRIEDYTYDLPNERIAQHPLEKRDQSKLLYRDASGEISDLKFHNIPELFGPDDLLIFNETRVIRARLIFPRGEGMKPIEVFCIDPYQIDIESAMSATHHITFKCMVGNAKKWKDAPLIWKDKDGNDLLIAEKQGREGGTFIIRFSWTKQIHFAAILEELGHMPLPPYMTRSDEPEDADRYQTVYATRDGSVAAPTAGLHFTEEVLSRIESAGSQLGRVILHVGAGTFKPVSSDTMEGHEMHSEALEISREIIQSIIERPRVTAVGTTSTRTLESLYWLGVMIKGGQTVDMNNVFVDQWVPYEMGSELPVDKSLSTILEEMRIQNVESIHGRTQIIIAPGYEYKLVKRLITNFHQPGSTLMLLVAAAIGEDWKGVYEHALRNDYRFLSYGDSSLLHIS